MAARKTVRDRRRVATHKRLARGVPKFDPLHQHNAQEFADLNKVGCFKCGRRETHWHKYGRQATGKPWLVCVACAKGPR